MSLPQSWNNTGNEVDESIAITNQKEAKQVKISTRSDVYSIVFLADGKHVVSGSRDRNIRCWIAADGKEVGEPIDAGSEVNSIAISQDGQWLVSGTESGLLTVWHANSLTKVIGLKGHIDWVNAVDISPDGTRIASGSDDYTACVWLRSTGKQILGPWEHESSVIGVKFSPDGLFIATATWKQNSIRIYDSQNGHLLYDVRIQVRSSNNNSIAWDNSSRQLYVSSSDGHIYCLDASSGEVITQWEIHGGTHARIVLARNGKFLTTCSDAVATFWDIVTHQRIGSVVHSTGTIHDMAISEKNHGFGMGGHGGITLCNLGNIIPSHYLDNFPSDLVVPCTPDSLQEQSYRTESGKPDPNDLTDQVTRDSNDPVASGGFADIYRGMVQKNGDTIIVAIKAIKTYSGEVECEFAKKKKRLRREIKVWFNLQHANVLPLLGTAKGFGRFPAMVCPWVGNGTLTLYLEGRYVSLTEIDLLNLLDGVGLGLHYLHSNSVVHGDLSGSNVLIRNDGGAYIADFGLSMLLNELGGSTFVTSFQARGTLRWTAPELLDLDVPDDGMEEELSRVAPTTQSDVYSFGGVMLQILTGKIPYHYYTREGQIVNAISKGVTPRRPNIALVTERRWVFLRRCWSIISGPLSRPESEDIVEFTEEELVGASTS